MSPARAFRDTGMVSTSQPANYFAFRNCRVGTRVYRGPNPYSGALQVTTSDHEVTTKIHIVGAAGAPSRSPASNGSTENGWFAAVRANAVTSNGAACASFEARNFA